MPASLSFTRDDRLLVFAPHPDDETLATGDAIIAARTAGAAVRVVFATDGDNNPWPQRWIEKRWTIGPAERARWGTRRRREAIAALAVLGVDDAEGAVFLGWPDQGLTAKLVADASSVASIGQQIERFAPTHVCMPDLGDRHPDHSALRVMCDLAFLRRSEPCIRLGYVVHAVAGASTGGDIAVSRSGDRKMNALDAHASQVALSRKRLGDVATRPERFELAPALPTHAQMQSDLRVRAASRHAWRGRHALLIVRATRLGDSRWCIPLTKHDRGAVTHADGVVTEWMGDDLAVTLPRQDVAAFVCYAKFDRCGPRIVVFDRELWHCGDALLASIPATSLHDAIADSA